MPARPRDSGLKWSESRDILRYWRSLIRHEEAMLARPRARRQGPNPGAEPEMLQPTAGRNYFKLPLDEAYGIACGEQPNSQSAAKLRKPLSAEIAEFFESWLADRYRQGGDDRTSIQHMLAFPVVHLPRGQLTGLFRVAVDVDFSGPDGQAFQVPSYRQRRAKAEIEPPTHVTIRLSESDEGEGGLPAMLDMRLLSRELSLDRDACDEVYSQLRGAEKLDITGMVEIVARVLSELDPPSNPEDAQAQDGAGPAMNALLTALGRRLATASARVYPLAIVLDASRALTTWHLQRDINALLDEDRDGGDWQGSPVHAYLGGRRIARTHGVQRASFSAHGCTASQAETAAAFWGSPLSAVQGPPGTGKTTTILELCAETMLRQMSELSQGQRPEGPQLMIASTNNRAVDNVIDSLCDQLPSERLPVALRAGSREVTERRLVPQVARIRDWLKAAGQRSKRERETELKQAKAAFDDLLRAVDAQAEPGLQRAKADARRAAISDELASLQRRRAELNPALAQVEPKHGKALLSLIARLELLSEAARGKTALRLRAVETQYAKLVAKHGPDGEVDLLAWLRECGDLAANFQWPLPIAAEAGRSPAESIEAWEEAIEDVLAELTQLSEKIEDARQLRAMQRRVKKLETELAGIAELASPKAVETGGRDFCFVDQGLAHEIYRRALAFREAMAAGSAEALGRVTEQLLAALSNNPSLRALSRDRKKPLEEFLQLFPIWGSTLLSLGNCLPPEYGVVERLVIDEAGQCHPAHAVAGLMRARSTMMIGDVHQLEPVIELGPDEESRLYAGLKLRLPEATMKPFRCHASAHNSAQSLADRAVDQRGQLREHFRCQPEIIAISDQMCGYGLSVQTPKLAAPLSWSPGPVALVEAAGEQSRLGGSWYNQVQLSVSMRLVAALFQAGYPPDAIAVITPYRGQLERLRRAMVEQRWPLERASELDEGGAPATEPQGIALGTVHRFQGGERRVVLFCSVITRRESLKFIDARPNLLNVAVSRAREQFIVIGDPQTLSQGRYASELLRGAQRLDLASLPT